MRWLKLIKKGRGSDVVRRLGRAGGRAALGFCVALVVWQGLLLLLVAAGALEAGPGVRRQFVVPILVAGVCFVWTVVREVLPAAKES